MHVPIEHFIFDAFGLVKIALKQCIRISNGMPIDGTALCSHFWWVRAIVEKNKTKQK